MVLDINIRKFKKLEKVEKCREPLIRARTLN